MAHTNTEITVIIRRYYDRAVGHRVIIVGSPGLRTRSPDSYGPPLARIFGALAHHLFKARRMSGKFGPRICQRHGHAFGDCPEGCGRTQSGTFIRPEDAA